MNPLKSFLDIVEIRTKVVSMSVFICASLAAANEFSAATESFPWGNWALMLLGTLAVDMGTTGFNTYFDFIRGADNKNTNREADKVLVHSNVSASRAFFTSFILFVIAGILGIIITLRTSWIIVPVGILSMLIGFFYSAGPRPISHTPSGEFFSGGFLGAVLFGLTWFVLTGNYGLRQLLISMPVSLMISGILTVNNNCDLENDKAAGRKTLTIVLGLTGGRILLWIEYGLGISLLFAMQYVMGIYPEGFLPVTVCLVAVIIIMAVGMEKRGYGPDTKGASMRGIIRIFSTGSLLLIYPWLFELIREAL